MNKTILIGRLTKEPELRATASGVSVCTFTLAVDRRSTQEGQQADFIPIVVWRNLAEHCAKYLHKGSQAAIDGSIQTRSYDAPDDSKRYITEVVANSVEFLGKPQTTAENAPESSAMESVEDEDIPF